MIKVYQQNLHNETTSGDCWIACIASILEIDINELPNPNDYDAKNNWVEYARVVLEKLDSLGYELLCQTPNEFTKLTDIMMVVGKSPRGDFNHCVLWDDKIIHDPHPDNTGVENIIFFEQLIKKHENSY